MNQAPIGKQFILGGRAILTLVGKASRFTFKVRRADPTEQNPNPTIYFVSLFTGGSNETDYTYMGVLDPVTGEVRPTKNSKLPVTHPGFVAAQWAFPAIWKTGRLPGGEAMHAGRCGRCARLLTDPVSIKSGFGPECRGKIGLAIPKSEVAEDYPGEGYRKTTGWDAMGQVLDDSAVAGNVYGGKVRP